MTARKILVVLVLMQLLTTTLAAERQPSQPAPEPQKLVAYAYVTVRPSNLASKATHKFVIRAAQRAIPAGRFEKLTVATEGTLNEARKKALGEKAQIFLYVIMGEPTKITYRRRVRVRRGWGRRGSVSVPQPFCTLRTPVVVELSAAPKGQWQQVGTVKLTSADVAGAEEESPRDIKDISGPWGRAARTVVPAGCERAINRYFLRHVSLRAIECEPAKSGSAGGEDAQSARTPIQIELVNRSHCRILDATVTAEQYNESRKRWEPVGASGPIQRLLDVLDRRTGGDGSGAGQPDGEIIWTVPAGVDPGEKALSRKMGVSDAVLLALRGKKCRLVLHATPAVWTLRPPGQPHRLKPVPKAAR